MRNVFREVTGAGNRGDVFGQGALGYIEAVGTCPWGHGPVAQQIDRTRSLQDLKKS